MEPYLADPDLTLYNGDALAVLQGLPDESVDCCVTSPPYWGLRDYGEEGQIGLEPDPLQYIARLVEIFSEVRRVLVPRGTLWLNLGDTYISKRLGGIPWATAFALQDEGWWLRSDIIWHKPNAMPSSVRDRPTTSHEYIFLMSKKPTYYFDRDAVLEPAAWERWGKQTVPKYEGTDTATGWIQPQEKKALVKRRTVREGIGKNIRSVWTIPTQPYPEAHFATFPEALARRCILAGCPANVCEFCGPLEGEPWVGDKCGHSATRWRAGVVLDPFAGSGTTGLVARSLQRHAALIELSPEYCELIAKRLQQLSLLA